MTNYKPTRQIGSTDQNRRFEPMLRLKSADSRSVRVGPPQLWNKLPTDIQDSKSLPHFGKVLLN